MPLTLAAQPCPSPVTILNTDFYPNRMAAAGNRLFVAAGEAGLAVLDFQDPAGLTVTSMLDTPGLAVDVSVSGTLALIADETAGLQVADVSNPAQPRLVGNLPYSNMAAVALDGTHAYGIAAGQGLIAADVSDPAHPMQTALVPWGGTAANGGVTLHAAGGLLYATDLYTGLWIYDVTDPAHPVLLGNALTYGLAWDLAVSGSRVIIAADFGIQIFDVSDPAAPSEITRLTLRGETYGVAVRGDYAYVAASWGGLEVVNVAGAPFETGYSYTTQNAFFVAVGNSNVFVGTNFRLSRSINVLSAAGCGARIIPAAAHVHGANGTHWKTDLVLMNPGQASSTADLQFIPFDGQPALTGGAPVDIPAGASVRLEDVVGTQWESQDSAGAVAVESAAPLVITSRTYTDGGDAGTAGQAVPSFSSGRPVDSSTETKRLYHFLLM